MRGMCDLRIGVWILIGLLSSAGLLSSTVGASADDVAGQITASTGAVDGGQGGQLSEGEHVNIGDDGGCSILVDDDALVELCGDTSMVLRREKGRRIVALDRGEIRLVVEPRSIEERVEIHTPAAVATLLGTIVHVSVDADGKTTISSAQSRISVRSLEPDIRGTTVINTGEQVSVLPGQAPPAKSTTMTPEQVAELGGCLVDFHSAAIGRDVETHGERVAERLAVLDAAYFQRSGAGALAARNIPGAADPIASQDVCTATDCRQDDVTDQDSFGQTGQRTIIIQRPLP